MEETYWEQRMKQIWLKTGDQNTKQFHLSVQQRRRKNNISSLQTNTGQWLTNPMEIAYEMISFFKNLFQEDVTVQLPTDFQQSSFSLDAADYLSITSFPSADTIWKVVKNMNPFGSPGPDGFPVIFYKKSWSVVGDDTVKFIQETFTSRELPIYSNLSRFNNQIQNLCPFCNCEEESIHHLLFVCPFSKEVLQRSPLTIDIPDNTSPMGVIQFWLEKEDQGITLNLAACILWNVREMRNDRIFSNTQPSISLCIEKALKDFKLFDLHHALNFSSGINISHQEFAQWVTPPQFTVKVNVDAAYNNGRGASAAIARDSNGTYLGCGAFCFSSFSSMVAELKLMALVYNWRKESKFQR
ncbi:uncharacterized protein LOC113359347 [Papaver somniferum]|uniref:uncharacterized protein LOC113359347 n=1 Tax=Papaver somniferum TaxID=3469 RepID=UPI000E700EDD|nr:uncharacterized protein LOC113359347 [Papaver somniferum]